MVLRTLLHAPPTRHPRGDLEKLHDLYTSEMSEPANPANRWKALGALCAFQSTDSIGASTCTDGRDRPVQSLPLPPARPAQTAPQSARSGKLSSSCALAMPPAAPLPCPRDCPDLPRPRSCHDGKLAYHAPTPAASAAADIATSDGHIDLGHRAGSWMSVVNEEAVPVQLLRQKRHATSHAHRVAI